MALPSPITEATDLVNITISVEGQIINAAYQVLYVMVSKEVNRIPFAKVHILDGDPSQESFAISSSTDFVPGNTIEIKAGYQESTSVIFSGMIIKHGIKIRRDNAALLMLDCRDKAVKMTIGRKNAYYQNTTDSSAIQQIIGTYGLGCDASSTSVTLKEIVQYYSTDWDFVLSRADINGQIVLTDQGKLTIKKPDTSQKPVLEVIYGQSLLGFDLEMDARTQLSSIQSSSWDYTSQAIIQATSQDPGLSLPGNITASTLAAVAAPSTFNLQSTAPIEQQSLQNWANAKLIKAMMAKIRGTVTFQGSALVNPGVLLSLQGLGTRFDGYAFASGVKHTIEDGNWLTEAALGLSPNWFAETEDNIVAPVTAGLLPGIQGLQIGVVSKIATDPDGEVRVLVKIPVINAATDSVWARLANFYATTNAGSFFYPETGDEVVLGFLNEDPRYPVILGSLFSSTKTAPYTPDEKNTYKAIVTNAQLKIEFDDVKKVTRILTPGNNSITLSDDQKSITIADQNSNTVTLSSSGISINSASNIEIKATQGITMSAGTSISASATGDVSISGSNVSVKADIQATVQGSASAQLTASGQVTVKGAVVMIN